MQRSDLENYIKKLKELESDLTSGEETDGDFDKELNNILSLLSNDISQLNSNQNENFGLLVKIKKLSENAVIPKYSKVGDAGMDLTITSIISETNTDVTYGFGIAMEIPFGYVGLVFPRSSVRKYDISLTNCVGVIDSGYRGELQATFKKTNWLKGKESEKYLIGDRGAQIMILPYPQVQMIEVNELSTTERGEGGFGSTGK
jgi:dUTP pyrophosphatase